MAADIDSDEVGGPSAPVWLAALDRLRGAYAERTLFETEAEYRRFEAWCGASGEIAFPATPPVLVRYLDEHFGRYSARTLENRLAYFRYVHRAHRLPDPTRDEDVRLAFRRGVRAFGARARQAAPLTAEIRDRLLAVCAGDKLIDRRDRVILRLGYDTLCRRSELVTLHFEDIARLPGGGAQILLRRSKTDPYGRATQVHVSQACLAEIDAWQDAAGLAAGPIIQTVPNRYVRSAPLHDRLIGDRLRLLAKRAGFPKALIKNLTAHSFRVGPAHDMAVAGYSLVQIMRAGRWRGLEAVALYVRAAPVNVWAAPPGVADHAANRA
jgi:integrase/recombinase XerD